ncbi:DUF4859 domain-containing protein [Carboxylicivirga caseinilyticus]|uniref:DUF4859 domain-containing protein n=1 Tax=Carboxylicivirga caseinilyticus TaxID=3417572 RepID=UPI003D33120B|nr:DUF4859 domain-containing protein [Marinilabiliaceae bacterium A049]
MKKINIYFLATCFLIGLYSCEDYDDFSSKHVYSEDENPYLRVDADATIITDTEFEVGRFEPYTIQLDDYAEKFETEMGMTVDQVISGLNNGTVLFYNINLSRNIWNKAAKTKGSNGWYYNSSGVISAEGDNNLTATVEVDPNSKTLIVNALEAAKAGTVFQINVGFAVNGPDYDQYIRFLFNVSITDPSIILTSITIPAGDYNNFGIDLEQYADIIEYNIGMTLDDFVNSFDHNGGGTIHMNMVDIESTEWDLTSSYTANPPGYWLNNEAKVCNWGETGFSLYAETNLSDKVLYIGRAPELASGNKYNLSVGYRDTSDDSKFFRFIITATLE